MLRQPALLLLCAPLFATLAAQADIYRWTDAQGRVHFGDQPADNAVPVDVRPNVVQGNTAAHEASTDAASPQPVALPAITLYTTASCPVCKQAKAFLRQKGLHFSELDIEKNPRARAEFKAAGGKGVPLIFVGNQRLHGFSAGHMTRVLRAAGYPI